MKELLRAYVNNCEKIPKRQLKMLPDDLVYSYFRKKLNEGFVLDDDDIKFYSKFINPDANEAEQDKLINAGVKISLFNKVYEDVIIKHCLILLDDFDSREDFLKSVRDGKIKLTERLLYFIILSFEKADYLGDFLLDYFSINFNFKINPKKVISEELKKELLSKFDISILIKMKVYLDEDILKNYLNKILNLYCDWDIRSEEKSDKRGKIWNYFHYIVERYDSIPDYVYQQIFSQKCKQHSIIDIVILMEFDNIFATFINNLFENKHDLLLNAAHENPLAFILSKKIWEHYDKIKDIFDVVLEKYYHMIINGEINIIPASKYEMNEGQYVAGFCKLYSWCEKNFDEIPLDIKWINKFYKCK